MHRAAPITPAIALLVLTVGWGLSGFMGCAAGGQSVGGTGTSVGGSGTGGSASSSSHTASASASSSSASSSSTGGGDAGNGCKASEKECNGQCVSADDPAFGCTPTGCTPCTGYPNAASACMGGMCALGACDTGFKNCDGNATNGCEANLQGDPNNCGSCGNVCAVPNATASCVAGACAVGMCNTGWTDCNGDPKDGCEVNTQMDPGNCGTCGKMCPTGASCAAGTCGMVCPTGTANCPGDAPGACSTTLGTNTDCNFCSDACNLPNADSQCQPNAGAPPPYTCTLVSCNTGFADCDANPANGCEVNTQTDAANCGTCGNLCPSGPHSTAVCKNGGCAITCDTGFLDCNNNPTDGCEVNGSQDTNNCGACGAVCPTSNDTVSCTAGACTITACNTGFADCNKMVADGCEANTTNDPKNCGMCGTTCTEANGNALCNGGACALGPCNAGFINCDGKYATGCNINGNSDPNNCGGCNNACMLPNSTPTCAAGMCATNCVSPFADCDMNPANGCEANLSNSVANCGSCGNACPVVNDTPSCANGQCKVGMCNTGFADCNGVVSDGCEVDTNSDPNNCGGCGVVCNLPNSLPMCVNGQCVTSCLPGYADCNGMAADGCEVDTATDPNNCGQCGANCNVSCGGAAGNVSANGTQCAGGKCSITAGGCAAGWVDFDGQCADGCECKAASTQDTCANAMNLNSSGTLTPGQSITPFSSTMTPLSVTEAYFTVTFGDNLSASYHPHIAITSTNNEFLMDVTQDCSGTAQQGNDACTDNGNSGSKDVTNWEVAFTNNVKPGMDYLNPIPAVGSGGQVWIRVYRNSAVTPTCNEYTITASD